MHILIVLLVAATSVIAMDQIDERRWAEEMLNKERRTVRRVSLDGKERKHKGAPSVPTAAAAPPLTAQGMVMVRRHGSTSGEALRAAHESKSIDTDDVPPARESKSKDTEDPVATTCFQTTRLAALPHNNDQAYRQRFFTECAGVDADLQAKGIELTGHLFLSAAFVTVPRAEGKSDSDHVSGAPPERRGSSASSSSDDFHSLFPPLSDDEQSQTDRGSHPPIQGWKMHYQPPTNSRKMGIALRAVLAKLVELQKDGTFKEVAGVPGMPAFKVVHSEENKLRTTMDPPCAGPLQELRSRNLFGKMVTIYANGQPKSTEMAVIVKALDDTLRAAGITDADHAPVPPFDCRITAVNGVKTLPGFSARYGVWKPDSSYRSRHNMMLKKTLDGKCFRRFAEHRPWHRSACPTTSLQYTDRDLIDYEKDVDLRATSELSIKKILERKWTCRPDWVTWEPEGLQLSCPCKETVWQGADPALFQPGGGPEGSKKGKEGAEGGAKGGARESWSANES